MLKFLIIFSCTLTLCFATLGSGSNETSGRSVLYFGDVKYFYETYKECSASHLTTCLKEKLLLIVDRVGRSHANLNLVEGVTFVPDVNIEYDQTAIKSTKELEKILPRALDDKNRALDNMLFDKIMSFFKRYTLQVKFPSVDDMQRSIEARDGGYGGSKGGGLGGNKGGKKGGHWIMIPLLLGSTLIPLAFGALALLAGKALIVSKLALALASIIGIKKLISGSGHHHEAAHEVVVSGGHGSGWGRIGGYNGQNSAYSGYTP